MLPHTFRGLGSAANPRRPYWRSNLRLVLIILQVSHLEMSDGSKLNDCVKIDQNWTSTITQCAWIADSSPKPHEFLPNRTSFIDRSETPLLPFLPNANLKVPKNRRSWAGGI